MCVRLFAGMYACMCARMSVRKFARECAYLVTFARMYGNEVRKFAFMHVRLRLRKNGPARGDKRESSRACVCMFVHACVCMCAHVCGVCHFEKTDC